MVILYKMVKAFEMDLEELLGFNVKEISAGTSSGEGYTQKALCSRKGQRLR